MEFQHIILIIAIIAIYSLLSGVVKRDAKSIQEGVIMIILVIVALYSLSVD